MIEAGVVLEHEEGVAHDICEVGGGWFEREGRGSATVEILGCTAGGHALFTDHIAAPGLFMEFGDGLRTTRIRTVRAIRAGKKKK